MKLLLWITLILLAQTACGQQLAPNDPILKVDPRTTATDLASTQEAVNLYITQAGLDKLAKILDSDPQHISVQLDKVVDNIVTTGIRALQEKGQDVAANQFFQRYNSGIKNWFQGHRDLFDHAPWSQFLVDFYACLETLLGDNMIKLLHLDDINIVNYCITVVFDPTNPEYDSLEYSKHFVPFAGCVSYWGSYIACVAVTWGSGAIAMICEPIGVVVEAIMVCCLAPQLSDAVYHRANGQ